MINRTLRVILVFALLANQAAICSAHTHYDADPSDRMARSHIHLSGHSHSHDSHSHDSHSHDSHHHHGPNDHQSDDHQLPELPASSWDTNFPDDHDGDALFVGDQDNFQHQSNRLIAKNLDSVVLVFVVPRPIVTKPAFRLQRTRAGPFATYRCAIYLQTSRLLV